MLSNQFQCMPADHCLASSCNFLRLLHQRTKRAKRDVKDHVLQRKFHSTHSAATPDAVPLGSSMSPLDVDDFSNETLVFLVPNAKTCQMILQCLLLLVFAVVAREHKDGRVFRKRTCRCIHGVAAKGAFASLAVCIHTNQRHVGRFYLRSQF